ncbi:hypothetical protein AVEN_112619-1 [Araneus ventricosus]|uniref:Uncharacterized protein n=1 Tax=Araneus ventricosus TaxID=182803 RepID=A0A4Y2Q6L6_ARAVE|nr:hypothetical protein AVEN_112619-1 [Araneus ventricosus]
MYGAYSEESCFGEPSNPEAETLPLSHRSPILEQAVLSKGCIIFRIKEGIGRLGNPTSMRVAMRCIRFVEIFLEERFGAISQLHDLPESIYCRTIRRPKRSAFHVTDLFHQYQILIFDFETDSKLLEVLEIGALEKSGEKILYFISVCIL